MKLISHFVPPLSPELPAKEDLKRVRTCILCGEQTRHYLKLERKQEEAERLVEALRKEAEKRKREGADQDDAFM